MGAGDQQRSRASWELFFDDITDPAVTGDQRGRPRGALYCVRLAPVYQRGADTPLECYFSCSDYRHSFTGVPFGHGRVYFSKITRANDPPGAWITHPVKVFDVSQVLTHVHTAQVTEFGPEEEPGVQMVASIGDTKDYNRFIRYVLPDITDDYMDEGNWLIEDQFHGTHATDEMPGSFSGQPAGVCFGPQPGTAIWSTDTTHDWLNMMVLPMTLEEQVVQAQFKHIYGMPACAGIAGGSTEPRMVPIVSTIKDVHPELAGTDAAPAVALYVPAPDPDNATSGPILGNSYRLLYTPAVSDQQDSWVQVAATRAGGQSALVYGDYIYWNHSTVGHGFKRIPVPEILSLEPVLIGPGGTNRAIQDCDFAPFSGVNTSLQNATLCTEVSPGIFEDPDTGLELPPVPCKAAAVYRIRSSRTSTTPSTRRASVGNILLSSDGVQQPVSWPADIGVNRARLWVLDGTYSALSPNKTTQIGISTDPEGTPAIYGGTRYSCGSRWCPRSSHWSS